MMAAVVPIRTQESKAFTRMSMMLTSTIRQSLAALRRRKLALPALLFLAGHRPLAFAAGQTLAVAAPVAALLDLPTIDEWATLLSAPEGPAALQAALADAVRTVDEP